MTKHERYEIYEGWERIGNFYIGETALVETLRVLRRERKAGLRGLRVARRTVGKLEFKPAAQVLNQESWKGEPKRERVPS